MAYKPRAGRVSTTFFFSFETNIPERQTFRGTCLNISDSGLLGVFTNSLHIGMEGTIALIFGVISIRMRARVARVNGAQAAFAFLPGHPGE